MQQKGLAPIIIILLIAIAIGGYLVYSGKINLPQKQATQITPENKSENLQELISIYGYSLKYPNSWETYLYNNGQESLSLDSSERFLRPKGQESAEISLMVSKKSNTSLEVMEKSLRTIWDETKVMTTKIDGIDAIKVNGKLKGKSNSAVLLQKGDYIYQIQTLGDYVDIFNQILSTFKFTK